MRCTKAPLPGHGSRHDLCHPVRRRLAGRAASRAAQQHGPALGSGGLPAVRPAPRRRGDGRRRRGRAPRGAVQRHTSAGGDDGGSGGARALRGPERRASRPALAGRPDRTGCRGRGGGNAPALHGPHLTGCTDAAGAPHLGERDWWPAAARRCRVDAGGLRPTTCIPLSSGCDNCPSSGPVGASTYPRSMPVGRNSRRPDVGNRYAP